MQVAAKKQSIVYMSGLFVPTLIKERIPAARSTPAVVQGTPSVAERKAQPGSGGLAAVRPSFDLSSAQSSSIRAAFLDVFVSLLRGYRHFLCPHKVTEDASLMDFFDKDGFLNALFKVRECFL